MRPLRDVASGRGCRTKTTPPPRWAPGGGGDPWGGAEPVTVRGEERTFLEDGDEVVITASAPGPGGRRIGFGEARGRILPARSLSNG